MQTRCYYYDTTELEDSVLFEYGISILPWNDRIQKISRYVFDRDKRLSLGVGLLLRHMLLEEGITDLSVDTDENGKLYLTNNDKLFFNLSHDGDIASCVLSDGPVGVDVCADRKFDKGIADLAFSGEENKYIEQSDNKDEAFTEIWAEKESYLKMAGTGLLRDPKSVTVMNMDCFSKIRIPGYQIVVCTLSPGEVSFTEWRLKKWQGAV